MPINTVLLTGKPGSGKGTQASTLAAARGWSHFSTGNRFRELRESEGPLGVRVREIYDAGKLMPDWFATYLFQDVMLNLKEDEGVVVEGYPRSHAQAEVFDDIMNWLERPYVVLDLAVSDEAVLARMEERSKRETRADSGAAVLRTRLENYREHTAPVLEFFNNKGKLMFIDGEPAPEKVTEAIQAALAQ